MINIQINYDNKCFKCGIVIRNRKADKNVSNKLDFKDIIFPAIIRDIHKIEKERILSASAFLVMNISNPCFKKICKAKYIHLCICSINTILLSLIPIDSDMVIHYIAGENIFVIIAYKLSLQNKY